MIIVTKPAHRYFQRKIEYLLWFFFIISKINSPKASHIFMKYIPLRIQKNIKYFQFESFPYPNIFIILSARIVSKKLFLKFLKHLYTRQKEGLPINELFPQGTFVIPELGKSSINQLSTVGRIICNFAPKFEARFEAGPCCRVPSSSSCCTANFRPW